MRQAFSQDSSIGRRCLRAISDCGISPPCCHQSRTAIFKNRTPNKLTYLIFRLDFRTQRWRHWPETRDRTTGRSSLPDGARSIRIPLLRPAGAKRFWLAISPGTSVVLHMAKEILMASLVFFGRRRPDLARYNLYKVSATWDSAYSWRRRASALNLRMPSASFSVAMASSLCIHRKVFSSRWR